jgi:hypothetical protein
MVIAATALISAINAATLKPTQCALWLCAEVPSEERNFFIAALMPFITARFAAARSSGAAKISRICVSWKCDTSATMTAIRSFVP